MHVNPGMYVGIDLGTTNTLVAQVTVDPSGKFTQPRCIGISQQEDEFGNMMHHERLPSAVYAISKTNPIVGRYAYKRMMFGHREDVIAWWKNDIGHPENKQEWRIGNDVWRPVEAAGAVLKHIHNQLESQFPSALDKFVVTVPASFPESMKDATAKAIRLAGWVNGNQRPLLVYEPFAALITYLDDYEKNELKLPPDQREPDWSEGGRIVVYDIGGGTIDVTLVKIEPVRDPMTGEQRLKASIEGYAPHTLLGGFRFDELFTEYLISRFQREKNLSELPKRAYNSLYNNILPWAEMAKMKLSNGQQETHRIIQIPEELDCGSNWDCQVTLEEYEAAVKPLLGEDATINSILPPIQTIGEASHVMEPVIRLLKMQQLEQKDIKAVLLVGGMGHVPCIRKRLETFFGRNTKLLWKRVDPIKSIAYGAALHNAQLHNNRSIHSVLLRSADLKVWKPDENRKVWIPIIPPQTTLSYGENFVKTINNLSFPEGKRDVVLKVRYGGVQRKGIRFQITNEVPNDSAHPMELTAMIDSHDHLLRLKAVLKNHPDISVEATFDETPEGKQTGERELPVDIDRIPDPEFNRPNENIGRLLNEMMRSTDSAQIAVSRKRIEKASRAGKYMNIIVQMLNLDNQLTRYHAALLIGHLYRRYTYDDKLNPQTSSDIAQILQGGQKRMIKRLSSIIINKKENINIRSQAAFALGHVALWWADNVDIRFLLDSLIDILKDHKTHRAVRTEIARAVGRTIRDLGQWTDLLCFWNCNLPVSVREAVLWAVSRGLTRNPSFIMDVNKKDMMSFLRKILKRGIRDINKNSSVEITAWRTIALFSITTDIDQKKPIYDKYLKNYSALIYQKALDEKNRVVSGRREDIQRSVASAAQKAIDAINGKKIIPQIVAEMEDLPIVNSV